MSNPSTTHTSDQGGRYAPKFTPKLRSHLILLARRGFTDEQMAELLGVSSRSINNWKASGKLTREFQAGKRTADRRVEYSLYERATGYNHPEEKIFCEGGVVTRVPTIKHVPADVTAQIFWLKNRDRANWNWDRIGQLDVNLKVIHPPDWNEFSRYFSVRDQAGSAVPSAPHPTNGHGVGAGAPEK